MRLSMGIRIGLTGEKIANARDGQSQIVFQSPLMNESTTWRISRHDSSRPNRGLLLELNVRLLQICGIECQTIGVKGGQFIFIFARRGEPQKAKDGASSLQKAGLKAECLFNSVRSLRK